MLWIYGEVVLLSVALFQNLGLRSRNAGGRWKTTDAALIKIPAVKAHITYFPFSAL